LRDHNEVRPIGAAAADAVNDNFWRDLLCDKKKKKNHLTP
jgi:hypothetical protein